MSIRHLFILPFLLLAFSLGAGAQGSSSSQSRRIQAVRVSFLTDKIKLSPEQSAKFWPVYNQYIAELRGIRAEFKNALKQSNPNISKEDARTKVDQSLEYQQRIVDLKKKYKDRLLQIISPQQLMQLYAAEQEFKVMLVKILQEKR